MGRPQSLLEEKGHRVRPAQGRWGQAGDMPGTHAARPDARPAPLPLPLSWTHTPLFRAEVDMSRTLTLATNTS